MHSQLAKKDSFHSMLVLSAAVHGLLFFTLFVSKFKKNSFEIEQSMGMNVMWSEVVMAPPKTAEDKLPGPIIEQPNIQKNTAEADNLTRTLKKETQTKPEKAKVKQNQLQSALDALDLEEDIKPTPKLDNFASDQNTEKKGLPSGPSGQGSLMGNPQFSRYKKQIDDHIYPNFYWLNKNDTYKTSISFYIDQQGSILNPKIKQSSGNLAFDNAALRAVKKSNPLPQPPQEIAKPLSEQEFIVNLSLK
ncbi:MAG TPA: TonB family protein [Oligoflexia bacterium]|nr:TonB family protein [Oligoflexia bacterium]HMR24585.1 TonB family protein [Oligoflexia bacterium]